MPNLRAVLEFPTGYRLFSFLIGAHGGRTRMVRDYIRPVAGQKVLDIGCGPAEIVGYLPDVEYYGFDSNPRYISYAKKRWAGRGIFAQESVSKQPLAGREFDTVLALGVVHHLDDREARELFQLAFEALRPGGRLITLDGVYVEDQAPLVRFILSKDRGKYIREARAYDELARTAFPFVKSDVVHDLMRPLPYTHLIMECTKPKA